MTLSLQVGARQVPVVHTPLWQSAPVLQSLPVAHPVGQEPPQSVSVSLPFFTPSLQVGSWQVLPEHTALLQSLPSLQLRPGVQSVQEPPQSVSLSSPFSTLSVQLGG